METSFNIHDDYEFEIYWSPFGLEVYSVNGKELLRKRSLAIRGSRKFLIGDEDKKHEVEIKIDLAPTRKSWISPGDWIAQAYVDGELKVEDLTKELRKNSQSINRIADKVMLLAFAILFILLAFIVIFRFIVK